MIVIGLLCGALGEIVDRARVQRDAVIAIERAGGKVMYDWEWTWSKGRPTPTGATRRPGRLTGWLTDHLGIDYLSDVTSVDLRNRGSDELLESVGRLRKLEYLNLAGSPVGDAGLAHLEGLTALRLLSLDYTDVTDAGLVHLESLTRLETLILSLTRVGDAGLPHLKPLTGLRMLSLSWTRVSDPGGQDLRRALPMTRIGTGGAGRAEARAMDLHEKAAKAKDPSVSSGAGGAHQKAATPGRAGGTAG
jgi:hypothetical protein